MYYLQLFDTVDVIITYLLVEKNITKYYVEKKKVIYLCVAVHPDIHNATQLGLPCQHLHWKCMSVPSPKALEYMAALTLVEQVLFF